MQIAVRELKNHLSEYLKQVQNGEDIVVTARGQPVAILSRISSSQSLPTPHALDHVAWIRSGEGGKSLWPSGRERIRPADNQSLSDLLLEDRE